MAGTPMEGRTIYGAKSLLNQLGHHSTASISAEIVVADEHWGSSASIAISDCSRTITLEFGSDYDNDVFKVKTLMHALREFSKGLKPYYDNQEKQKLAREAKKEEGNGLAT